MLSALHWLCLTLTPMSWGPGAEGATQVQSGWVNRQFDWTESTARELDLALFGTPAQQVAGTKVLSGWGPEALPALFEVLVSGQTPPWPERPRRALDADAQELLCTAMTALGRASVLALLSDRLSPAPAHEESIAALLLLERVAGYGELGLCFAWAQGAQSSDDVAGLKFKEILSVQLSKDPPRCIDLRSQILASNFAVAEAALLAVEQNPCREQGLLLSRLLGGNPQMDPSLVSRLGKYWEEHPAWIDSVALDNVRRLGKVAPGPIAAASLTALGRARDEGSIPLMLEAVEGDDRVRSSAAHLALEQISGLRIRAKPQLWRRHYERSQAWELARAEAALQALYDGDRGEVAAYLREISEQRMASDRWSEAVCRVFQRGDVEMSYQAVAALRALRSPRSIPTLLKLVGQGQDRRLRDLANEALRVITGLGLPPDVSLWRTELGLD
jgi:hypothetical protein